MHHAGKCLQRGFENAEFRCAVFSFLKEKCPDVMGGGEDLSVSLGLKIIRQFIERKKTQVEGAATAVAFA